VAIDIAVRLPGESYTWLVILGGWSLLLLLGLAGGDPLAAGRPGQEAPAFRLARWVACAWGRARAGAGVAGREAGATRRPAAPGRAVPPAAGQRPTESGLHAVV
jgi:hypothetical protein